MARGRAILAFVILGIGACTRRSPPAPAAADAGPSAAIVVEAAARPTVPLGRVGDGRTGSTVVLAQWGDTQVAFVADEDDHAIRAIDVEAARELSVTPLPSRPAQLLVTADGRLLVAMRDAGVLASFRATDDRSAPLVAGAHTDTAVEPLGLAMTPDDASVLLVSGWGHTFESFRADTLERRASLDLAREPRAITTSADGAAAYVAHATASQLTVIALRPDSGVLEAVALDLGTGPYVGGDDTVGPSFAPRVARQAFALARLDGKRERIFVPHTSVDSGGGVAFSSGYGGAVAAVAALPVATPVPVPINGVPGAPVAAPLMAMSAPTPVETAGTHAFDIDTIDPRKSTRVTDDRMPGLAEDLTRGGKGACLLPRAAAVDGAHGELLVACRGIDEVRAYDASKDDPTGWKPRRRWSVPAGADGIAVDVARQRAVVWSAFDGVLSVLSLTRPARTSGGVDAATPDPVRVPVTRATPLPADVALGRKLFFDAGDPRIAKDGRACASCHIDGREDGLVWSSPEGPRQTMMLAGRVDHVPPFAWLGEHPSLEIHLGQTLKNLAGKGLEPPEVAALIAWIKTMKGPPDPERTMTPLEAHGREVFESTAADCSSCHVAKGGFSDHMTHDVGSASRGERKTEFVTPSLRFVAGTAPYFHDGRYATLEALLRDPKSHMGGTRQLPPDDVNALAAFLRML